MHSDEELSVYSCDREVLKPPQPIYHESKLIHRRKNTCISMHFTADLYKITHIGHALRLL